MRKADKTYLTYCSSCYYCRKRVKDAVKCSHYKSWVKLTFDKCHVYFNPEKSIKRQKTKYLFYIALGLIMIAAIFAYAIITYQNKFF